MPDVTTWLHELERAADAHEPADITRPMLFRQVLADVYEAGRRRGYLEGADDTHRALLTPITTARPKKTTAEAAHRPRPAHTA